MVLYSIYLYTQIYTIHSGKIRKINSKRVKTAFLGAESIFVIKYTLLRIRFYIEFSPLKKIFGQNLPKTGVPKSAIFKLLISTKLAECTKILFLIMKVPLFTRPYTIQNQKSHRCKICYDFSKIGTFLSVFWEKNDNF